MAGQRCAKVRAKVRSPVAAFLKVRAGYPKVRVAIEAKIEHMSSTSELLTEFRFVVPSGVLNRVASFHCFRVEYKKGFANGARVQMSGKFKCF